MQIILSISVILLLTLAEISENNADHTHVNQMRESPNLLLAISNQKKVPSESQGFQKIGNKMYYIEEDNQLNWITAMHKCHEMGAHLASLQNESEYLLLKAKLNVNRNYWIDINDINTEGEYLSLTTGLKAPYLNWYGSYNPDNYGGNENCVWLWNKDQSLGMNDAQCNAHGYFVCEKTNFNAITITINT